MGSWLAAAIVGVVYGAAGTIAHSLMWGPIPIGLIIGAIACGSLLVAVRALTHDRGATLATAVGMLGMLLLISGPGPGGSVIVPNTPAGQVWIYVIAGLALLVIAWPSLPRRVAPVAVPQPTAAPEPAPLITAVPRETPESGESTHNAS